MKYYSDVLNTLFDTQDALEKAEAEKKAAEAEAEKNRPLPEIKSFAPDAEKQKEEK